MTKEDIKQICQIYDNLRRERDAATIAYNSDNIFWEHVLVTYNFSRPSLPGNLDEAANNCIAEFADYIMDENTPEEINLTEKLREIFKAGAEWMAGQGWKEVNETDYPKPDKHKLYCVYTKGHYLLATVILNPNDDALCQWRSTEFPHRRHDMCEGDKYLEITRESLKEKKDESKSN